MVLSVFSVGVIYNLRGTVIKGTEAGNYLCLFLLLYALIRVVRKLLLGEQLFSIADGTTRTTQKTPATTEFNLVKKPDITLDAVAGNEEAKDDILELVDFLVKPEKFEKYGAKIPRGTILVGPPGTGKTLLAKALAGTAGVSFISVSGSEFVEMYVGVGAARMRKLFETAKKNAPCIIFIDEIDAVGKKRATNPTGGTDERDQTLNQLLVEMNGFKDSEGVIVMAATNRIEMLDEALVRSGRFDRHITVSLPDLNSRHEILKIHSKNKPLSPDIDLAEIAKMTLYMSGADLENVMNEASIYASRFEHENVLFDDITRAINKIVAGEEKKNREAIHPEDRQITAWHEAGHALVAKLLTDKSIPKVTIIPTTKGAGGYTLINQSTERMFETKSQMLNDIAISVAGRLAEEIYLGASNVTGGASNDFKQATQTARRMVEMYGMSENIGFINCEEFYRGGVSSLEEKVWLEVKTIIDDVYKSTREVMTKNKAKLAEIAGRLIDKETIYEQELTEIIAA